MSYPAFFRDPRLLAFVSALKRRESWVLLGLGFSAGLPFLLTGATLGFWLRDLGLSLSSISLLTLISLLYGLKVLWAPLAARLHIPFVSDRLGQPRTLMLLAQFGIFAGLIVMAQMGPTPLSGLANWGAGDAAKHLGLFALILLWIAFFAATQEIAIDGWRVQMTQSNADNALYPTLFNLGFRLGILATDTIILVMAKRIGWALSIEWMAFALIIGVMAVFWAPKYNSAVSTKRLGFIADIFAPFQALAAKHEKSLWLWLALIAVYRLPDYLIGPVAAPMYQDTGLDYDTIAAMRGSLGLSASLIGIVAGGFCLLRLGLTRTLFLGAFAGPFSNLGFAIMAVSNGDPVVFGVTLLLDNFSNGIAEAAIIALMTKLVDKDQSITQYALLYSVMAFTGKVLKSGAGFVVDSLTPLMGQFGAYAAFFTGTALVGILGLILCAVTLKKLKLSPLQSNSAETSP